MGFQDNSGDIIFDVVLTDEGRRQLAKGDGSFKISKFKLGDDEVNYALFDTTTGSAYQDLQILQTPVFESFANNTSNMSSLLINYPSNNLLYLPVIKLNEVYSTQTARHALGNFVVAVDMNTEGTLDENNNGTAIAIDSDNRPVQGFLFGATPTRSDSTYIRVDAGIDNDARPPNSSTGLEADLNETGYLIELDYRLGRICDRQGNLISPLYVDDDNIAVYRTQVQQSGLGAGAPGANIGEQGFVLNNTITETTSTQTIAGLRSTFLQFKIVSTQELRQSNFYFNKFGSEVTSYTRKSGGSPTTKIIDTICKVTGINTGFTLELNVRFAKLA